MMNNEAGVGTIVERGDDLEILMDRIQYGIESALEDDRDYTYNVTSLSHTVSVISLFDKVEYIVTALYSWELIELDEEEIDDF